MVVFLCLRGFQDRFPPNIYYKIFTHRPIQDLCANSPKDYTRPEAKQLTVRHKHNKIATLPPQDDPGQFISLC